MRYLFSKVGLMLFVLMLGVNSFACTNFIITKGAAKDSCTIISYSADSHDLYGELYHFPAADYAEGALLDIYEWDTGKYLGKIKQATKTYSVIGNINENQVSIGETTFTGREELQDTLGIVDYGSLIYIALQRSKSAREAIDVMTSLVNEYGYYSTGESFSIADPNEAWIMEMIGKGPENKGAVWVARRIPDGFISGHANQARITKFPLNDPKNTLYSPDVIDFAIEKGYYSGDKVDFSFADAYAPLDYGAIRFSEARVWAGFRRLASGMDKYEEYFNGDKSKRFPLWVKPSKKVEVKDVMAIMRDHYEGTELDMTNDIGAGPFACPYRFRPLTWKVDTTEYFNERAIATQQTGFSFVAQMRSYLPNPVGGILWFGVDDAAASVYVPIYCGITEVPYNFKVGVGSLLNFTWESNFWVFNWVSNMSYNRYSLMHPDILKVQKELEDRFLIYSSAIDKAALDLYQKDVRVARDFLTEYSAKQSELVHERWTELGQFLMVKYLDGNLHEERNGVFLKNPHGHPAHAQFPGYSPEFYKKIAETTGDKLKMKPLKK